MASLSMSGRGNVDQVAGMLEGEAVCVDAIGSGGGQGAIFKFSWGAEESFVGTVEKILTRQGFM